MSVTFIYNVVNVDVFPFIDTPIVVKPVITGAEGKYVVGTFGPSVGYQLYISGGEQHGELTLGAPYYATATVVSTQPPFTITDPQIETHVVHYEGRNAEGQQHFGFVSTFGRHPGAPEPAYEEAGTS
jgi:hypothetical protein